MAAAGATALLVAGSTATGGPVTCPFRLLTGCDCPLCGATRATAALLRGRVGRAIGYNALYVAFVPLIAWAWVLDVRGRFEASSHPFRRRAFWYAAGVVAVAFAVVRNVPADPWRALRS